MSREQYALQCVFDYYGAPYLVHEGYGLIALSVMVCQHIWCSGILIRFDNIRVLNNDSC